MSLPPGASDVRRIGGGDINEAFHVVLADGREAFVKTRADAAPGEYAAEAAGLRLAGRAGGAAHAAGARARTSATWRSSGSSRGRLDAPAPRSSGGGWPRPTLPALRASASRTDAPGHGTARFGSLRLPNDPAGGLADLLRRAAPAAAGARSRASAARCPRRRSAAVESVCERMGELCGPPEPPARLHGDLWSGNVMADAQRPPMADRSLGLRRAPRGRSGDAAAVRGARRSVCSRPMRSSRRWPTGWQRAGRALPAASAARARAAVRRLLPRGGRAHRSPLRLSAEPLRAASARRVPPAGCGRRRGCAPAYRLRAPAPVPARAGDRRAPLPPPADAAGGGRGRWRARRVSCSGRMRSSARSPSRRICSRGGWRRPPSCWSSSGRSRWRTWPGWSATARRPTSRGPSAAATASRRRASASGRFTRGE